VTPQPAHFSPAGIIPDVDIPIPEAGQAQFQLWINLYAVAPAWGWSA
jgi:hypothetical protein